MTDELFLKQLESVMPKPKVIGGVRFYSMGQAAELLQVHVNTLRYWVKSGKVMHRRIGATKYPPTFIPEYEIERILAGRDAEDIE